MFSILNKDVMSKILIKLEEKNMLYYKGLFLQGIMLFTTHISLSMDNNPPNNDFQQPEERLKRSLLKVGTPEYKKFVKATVKREQVSDTEGKNLKNGK
jgi:hypothetical protein